MLDAGQLADWERDGFLAEGFALVPAATRDRAVATSTPEPDRAERRRFDVPAGPLDVVLGNAEAVNVTMRGAPFDTTPFVKQNVAKFQIKP